MRIQLLLTGSLALAPLALALGAAAQAVSPIEAELEAESVVIITPLSDDSGLGDTQALLGELSLKGQAETVLDNGVRIRARTRLRLQTDHPLRPGATGGFGAQAGVPVGAFSGLSTAPPRQGSDTRIRLETAYLQIDGGYGELRIGKHQGIASRFHEGSKSALTHARLDSALLDPSGLSAIRTRNDLTGPSLKLSYASPRILGLRAGVSYTPEAEADGLDRRPAGATGLSAPDTSNAFEAALNASRKFRSADLRIDGALTWSTADVRDRAGIAPYGQVETLSAGTRLERGDWTLGGSWLASNNGLAGADYTAWSAGVSRRAYAIDWSVNYGEADDDGAAISTSGWRFVGSRALGSHTRLAIAYTHDTLENSFETSQFQGIVVEITLSQEILKFTGN